ncbi:vWA domain-containing protein [Zavarzinia compransoris]|uniref:Carbon monoxide dehydrogenase n=1 Tax=Zavarzinia compransoris TaxID=1264899 RepID=A0A317E4D3_9PROT|nr:VWA domain-containing protein [Zavarzinia compransoris]PWR21016.1 carbon monoxide dehydrogenase [Zavarzinia compransoris]TDP44048.1 uncharacterized protein with von Willebrand factor type A (vWA) domain [Zavarzinia compransoris]
MAAAGELLRRRMAGFAAALREHGFAVGLRESADALAVIAAAGLRGRLVLRAGLRALFASRQADWRLFDDLFDAYWLGRHLRAGVRITPPLPQRQGSRSFAAAEAGEDGGDGPILRSERRPDDGTGEGDDAAPGRHERGGAAASERLGRTDFRHVADPAEQERLAALVARLAARMRARLTRRQEIARGGPRIDLRRTLHRSVGRGGVPVDLVRRRRRPKPLKLVVLLDASGSMGPYTAVFVRFIHGVLSGFRQAAAFLFHTRLADITEALQDREPQRALDRLSLIAEGVGGGTRIGDCLATFNRWHAARALNSRSAVIIVSDGYDTGEAPRLGREMAALRRRCRRIAWLNPMMGWRDYAPVAAGMRAALPHLDLFAPAHDLESLEALEPYLARL